MTDTHPSPWSAPPHEGEGGVTSGPSTACSSRQKRLSGKPTALRKSPSARSTSIAPSACSAYPPALSLHGGEGRALRHQGHAHLQDAHPLLGPTSCPRPEAGHRVRGFACSVGVSHTWGWRRPDLPQEMMPQAPSWAMTSKAPPPALTWAPHCPRSPATAHLSALRMSPASPHGTTSLPGLGAGPRDRTWGSGRWPHP